MIMIITIMGFECKRGCLGGQSEGGGKGKRRGYLGVKRIEVHYI
jgi:hypothetical protein